MKKKDLNNLLIDIKELNIEFGIECFGTVYNSKSGYLRIYNIHSNSKKIIITYLETIVDYLSSKGYLLEFEFYDVYDRVSLSEFEKVVKSINKFDDLTIYYNTTNNFSEEIDEFEDDFNEKVNLKYLKPYK